MADENLHKDHRKRLRQRYDAEGLDSFAPHNVLELLLFYAIPRVDTNPIAHRLIARFGSLPNVFEADVEELQEVEGIGPSSAEFIKFVADISRQISLRELSELKMNRAERIGAYFVRWFENAPWETSCIMSLDSNMSFLGCDVLNWGDKKRPPSMRTKALECAMMRKAAKVILAHSHGDGKMRPSPEDYALTHMIAADLESHSIKTVGHYIVSGFDYLDFLDQK